MNKKQEVESKIKELDEWIKTNPDSRELKRAIAVKLTVQGWSYQAIASILNVCNGFISKWKKQYKVLGKEGLKLGYQGRKSYLTETEKEQVLSWLQEQKYWDLSELECYLIEQYDVGFKSPTSYYSLLKEARITWQKAQGKNPRKKPEIVQKRNQEIQSFLKKLEPKIEDGKVMIYAIDEVHLLEGDLISHLWGEAEKRLKIPLLNPKNRQSYYGALELTHSQLIVEEYPQANGENTVDFLKKLREQNPDKQMVIFWDGASYHPRKVMRKFLEEVNGELPPEQWRITCHLFAPYAPEENPIEAIWLSLKSLLRRCYRFCHNFPIMKKLFNLLIDYQLFNFPSLKNYDAFSCLI